MGGIKAKPRLKKGKASPKPVKKANSKAKTGKLPKIKAKPSQKPKIKVKPKTGKLSSSKVKSMPKFRSSSKSKIKAKNTPKLKSSLKSKIKSVKKPIPAKITGKNTKQDKKVKEKPDSALKAKVPKKHKAKEEAIVHVPAPPRKPGVDVEIIPAILAKTKYEFEFKMYSVIPYARRIQIDIMDGKFVPNITIGENEKVPLKDGLTVEYHLMVQNPIEYITLIGNPDAIYIVHVESEEKTADVMRFCKSEGYKIGLAINPATKIDVLDRYMPDIEMVLFMTVVPGFSGQAYIPAVEAKIAEFRKKYPKIDIEVDGGITEDNIRQARVAGANLLASASAIFSKPDLREAMAKLYEIAQAKE